MDTSWSASSSEPGTGGASAGVGTGGMVPVGNPIARAPSNQDKTTYIRLLLLLNQITGASLSSSSHFFRCIRGGKQVKITGAHVLSSSPDGTKLGEKMQLYARVCRRDYEIFEEPGTDPLLSTIELVCIDSNKNQSLISSCSFDMAHYITTLIDKSSRQMTDTLHFSPDVSVDVNITIKTIGDNFLQPYSPPPDASPTVPPNMSDSRRRGIRATTPHATDPDEMVAAQELDRLRHQQIQPSSSITTSSAFDEIDGTTQHAPASAIPIMPVTATPPASFEDTPPSRNSSDMSAMQTRIRTLEDELFAAKRERKEAERKVSAHETHSKKIKETYTQLASWYNTLRQEHMELQKKIPKTETEDSTEDLASSSTPVRVKSNATDSTSSNTTAITHDDEHSNDAHSIELREQAIATQQKLEERESELQTRTNDLNDARQKLQSLQMELDEKDQMVKLKEDELQNARSHIIEMEEVHKQNSARLEEDMKKLSSQQLSELSQRHNEEIEALREQHEQMIEERQTEAERQVKETQTQSQQWQEKAKYSEDELNSLKDRLRDVEGKENDFQQIISNLETENQNLSQQVQQRTQREEVQRKEQETEVGENMGKPAEDHQNEITALREECASLREQINTVEKENSEASASPRQIGIMAGQVATELRDQENSESAVLKSNLEAEMADLKSQLKMEIDKRKEVHRLLDKSEGDHDDLRAMVKRLRYERDKAQDDIKIINDKLLSMKHSVGSINNSISPKSSTANKDTKESAESLAIEARDKAIREVFKVRKDLNKKIRILKKDNEELAKKASDGASASSSSSRGIGDVGSVKMTEQLNLVTVERDQAKSELEEVKTGYESKLAEVSQRLSNIEFERDDAISQVEQLRNEKDNDTLALSEQISKVESERDEVNEELQQVRQQLQKIHYDMNQGSEREKSAQERLNLLQEEINSHKSQIGTLEDSLSEATKQADEQVGMFEQEKDDLMRKIENAEETAVDRDEELQKKNAKINELREKVMTIEEFEENIKLVTQERDVTLSRCQALEEQVNELKQSLGDAASQDELMRATQKECDEHIVEITVLKTRMDEIKLSSSETESDLKSDISNLQAELTKASNTSQRFETRAEELERKAAEYNAELEIERVKRENEASERERLQQALEDIRSRNEALTTKLSEEQSIRQAAQEEVSNLNVKVSELEGFMNDMDEKIHGMEEAMQRIQKDRDDAIETSSSLREKLSQVESDARETSRELKCLEEKLASSESSREILQQKAVQSGGESQKVVEELNMLRAELEKARKQELETASQLDGEKTSSSVQLEKDARTISDLREENERLMGQMETLEGRMQRLEGDVNEKKQRLSIMGSQVETIRNREQELESLLNDRTQEILTSQRDMDRMNENHDSTSDKYMCLINEHEELKRQLSNRENAISMSLEEQHNLENRAHQLNGEKTSLQGRLRAMAAEHEERMATERLNFEREIKKSSKLYKDLQHEREVNERQGRELEQLREQMNSDKRDSGSGGGNTNGNGNVDQNMFNSLVDTQLKLAYAQEEVMTLRNKLKKMDSKASGGMGGAGTSYSSFEF